MMPLAVRTTQTSADEGRLKTQVGGKSIKAKKKRIVLSAVRNWANGNGG